MATVLSQRVFSPTVLLYSFVVISQFASGLYAGLHAEPPWAYLVLYWIALIWIMGWWLLADSHTRGVSWVYDTGFFVYIAWPIPMTCYLFKTRCAKALLVILGFIGAYLGAAIAGVVVSMVVTTMTGRY
jgi:hypothetical protein